jgi:hypothetical protein
MCLFYENLFYIRNIIRVIESRRMGWAGHVSCLEEKRNAECTQNFRKPDGKRHFKVLGLQNVW